MMSWRRIASSASRWNVITLKLAAPSKAKMITYLTGRTGTEAQHLLFAANRRRRAHLLRCRDRAFRTCRSAAGEL